MKFVFSVKFSSDCRLLFNRELRSVFVHILLLWYFAVRSYSADDLFSIKNILILFVQTFIENRMETFTENAILLTDFVVFNRCKESIHVVICNYHLEKTFF